VLEESAAAMGRIEGFITRAIQAVGERSADVAKAPKAFAAAMNEDLAIPQALAVLHDTVRAGNAALDASDNKAASEALEQVLAITEVLGINPIAAEWKSSANAGTEQALAVLVDSLLAERLEARTNKDFARSDKIRDRFKAAGITIEDGASGTNWSVN